MESKSRQDLFRSNHPLLLWLVVCCNLESDFQTFKDHDAVDIKLTSVVDYPEYSFDEGQKEQDSEARRNQDTIGLGGIGYILKGSVLNELEAQTRSFSSGSPVIFHKHT